MMKKMMFIIGFLYLSLIVPSIIFASCDQSLKDCTLEAEKWYSFCLGVLKADIPLHCEAKGYKPYSKDYIKCEKDLTNNVIRNCRKQYRESTDLCYSTYKKSCRKGDIFGKVRMEVSSVQDDASSHRKGEGSFTIMGFWKYKPEESNELVKNYRPEGLQMMGLFEEKVNEKNPDEGCSPLLWQYQGGGASVLMVDPNVDYQNNPLGRLTIYNMPSKPPKEVAKFLPKDIAKLYGPFYKVGFGLGRVIEIEGKERVDNQYPECLSYKKSIIKVRFGEFLISDDLKMGGMSGSESWISCGILSDKYVGDDRSIDFEISKDKVTISEEGKPQYFPPSESGCDKSISKIKVYWKFHLIK